MTEERISKLVEEYARVRAEEYDDELTGEQRSQLLGALVAADGLWPVREAPVAGDGFLLAWNEGRTNERLRGDEMRGLAGAIDALEELGVHVTLGRSAKGYTYLNVRMPWAY